MRSHALSLCTECRNRQEGALLACDDARLPSHRQLAEDRMSLELLPTLRSTDSGRLQCAPRDGAVTAAPPARSRLRHFVYGATAIPLTSTASSTPTGASG